MCRAGVGDWQLWPQSFVGRKWDEKGNEKGRNQKGDEQGNECGYQKGYENEDEKGKDTKPI